MYIREEKRRREKRNLGSLSSNVIGVYLPIADIHRIRGAGADATLVLASGR